MSRHPSAQRLELFMTGELPAGESPAIMRHLVAGCSECATTTSHLWEVLVTGRGAPEAEPEEYEAAFLDLMKERQIEDEIDPELFAGATVLLCSEPTPERCHRRLVVEYLDEHWGDVRAVHL